MLVALPLVAFAAFAAGCRFIVTCGCNSLLKALLNSVTEWECGAATSSSVLYFGCLLAAPEARTYASTTVPDTGTYLLPAPFSLSKGSLSIAVAE